MKYKILILGLFLIILQSCSTHGGIEMIDKECSRGVCLNYILPKVIEPLKPVQLTFSIKSDKDVTLSASIIAPPYITLLNTRKLSGEYQMKESSDKTSISWLFNAKAGEVNNFESDLIFHKPPMGEIAVYFIHLSVTDGSLISIALEPEVIFDYDGKQITIEELHKITPRGLPNQATPYSTLEGGTPVFIMRATPTSKFEFTDNPLIDLITSTPMPTLTPTPTSTPTLSGYPAP